MSTETNSLARITWSDPTSGTVKEFVLMEGATATIGRHASNDICIPEQHVSRQHAVINYRSGMFVLTDLGSANGTFLNDQQVAQPLPLVAGDVIRLYVPVLQFSALVSDDERREAERNGTLIAATTSTGKGKLIITNGPQEGNIIPLLLRTVRIGRATSKADWEIGLQDLSVSRPLVSFASSCPDGIDRKTLDGLRPGQQQRHLRQRHARERKRSPVARWR